MWSSFDAEGGVHLALTSRSDGDQRPGAGGVPPLPVPAQFARQVHGAQVAVVDELLGAAPNAGVLDNPALEVDALVTDRRGLALGALGADCSLVALVGSNGALGIVHAGWRGLLAGVVENAAHALRSLGAERISAFVGPTIGPECYAFSQPDLEPLVERFGPRARSSTADGSPALDLPAAIDVALAEVGVSSRAVVAGCTACDCRRYSYRARREAARHALYVWREDSR